MENIVVLNEEQFEDIIYRTVSRCLDEKNIGNFGEKPEDEGFYTRDELCELLHIAYPTLWRIEQSGILKCQKVGRKNLYSKQEVNILIKSGKLAKYGQFSTSICCMRPTANTGHHLLRSVPRCWRHG